MLILLPPSEGKSAPSRGRPLDLDTLSFPDLTPARSAVLDALVDFSATEGGAAALGVPASQPELLERNLTIRTAPTARADRIYTGVLYDALGLDTLSPAARRRATSRVVVTSALFGLVRPADRIPAYRLSGDAKLPGLGPHGVSGSGSVARHWRSHLGPAITEAVGSGLLVDLRSSGYAAFWKPAGVRVATVRVLHEVDGHRQVVSHFNKATKGRLVRALLEDGANPRTPQRLAQTLNDLGRGGLGWQVEHDGDRLDVVVGEL